MLPDVASVMVVAAADPARANVRSCVGVIAGSAVCEYANAA